MKRFAVIGVIVMGMIVVLTSFSKDEAVDEVPPGKLLFSDPILSKDKK